MARRHGAVIFATGLYVVVALYYRYWGGLSITIDSERNTWDWFWQAAPLDLLRGRRLEPGCCFHAHGREGGGVCWPNCSIRITWKRCIR